MEARAGKGSGMKAGFLLDSRARGNAFSGVARGEEDGG